MHRQPKRLLGHAEHMAVKVATRFTVGVEFFGALTSEEMTLLANG